MLRKGLLVSTALIFAASVACAAAQPRAISSSQMQSAVAGHDANGEFLCSYGGFAVSATWSSSESGSYYIDDWNHVATPIVGRGQTVNRIIVEGTRGSDLDRGLFHADIHRSNRDGSFGKWIAGGAAKAPITCGKITIQIAPTRLDRNKTYWVEERIHPSFDIPNKVSWAKDPKSKLRSYEQYHKFTSTSSITRSSYTSPWTELSAGAYVRVK